MSKKDEVFAIRCFRNGKRRLTHKLTKGEAKVFRHAAMFLARYLEQAYKLPKARLLKNSNDMPKQKPNRQENQS